MNKSLITIGYGITTETSIDVWEDVIEEKQYYAELSNISRVINNQNEIIEGIDIKTTISIICDPFVSENFSNIKYVVLYGNKWKVSSVSIYEPRLTIVLGGLYNENQT